jgi:hypothetical protein
VPPPWRTAQASTGVSCGISRGVRTLLAGQRHRRVGYASRMPTLLVNLRQVPDDEADEIRQLFEANSVAFFETPASRFGISAGAIWLSDEADAARARQLLAAYQQQRRENARSAFEAAREDGRPTTFWGALREQPLRVLSALIVMAALVALCLLPYFLLRD